MKRQIEAKAKAERDELERKEAEELAKKQAPDKEKLTAWINHYLEIGIPEFSDKKFLKLAMEFQNEVEMAADNIKSKL